ncbi:GNAT family N-acetyltransferase [Peptoniphilus indolicus]|uniref:Phosphinothricin acetyltransferase n=2 Tax=Peptoniphilus indolicus TaxID=33030 RepID=G4D3G7_9FIRM|nr:GNAT family N-acetyltransferase [Peptoniphilus indolicus]EGY79933.1 phosphinothricin acetyltransferase [Peptoniphilus indolicus ATCC 29427]SUB75636.1 Phosphinothricin N-acetyltransferase [Peptoniphilus indolicus]
MNIRRVNLDDTKDLLAIYSPYVIDTSISFEYEPPTEAEFRDRIESISTKYPYIVAEVDGEIVGYAYANVFKSRAAYDKSVETSIYLRKGNRRNGIGRKLYDKLEELLIEQGIVNMCACITTADEKDSKSDGASIEFHKKMGFEFVGEFKHIGYKFGKWYGVVWAQKTIGEIR